MFGIDDALIAATIINTGAQLYQSRKNRPKQLNPDDYRSPYATLVEPQHLAVIDDWMKRHGVAIDPKRIEQVQGLSPWAPDVYGIGAAQAILDQQQKDKEQQAIEKRKQELLNEFYKNNPEGSPQDANNYALHMLAQEGQPRTLEAPKPKEAPTQEQKPVQETPKTEAKPVTQNQNSFAPSPRQMMLAKSPAAAFLGGQPQTPTPTQPEFSTLDAVNAGASVAGSIGQIIEASNQPKSRNPDDYRSPYSTLIVPRSLSIADALLEKRGVKADPNVIRQVEALSPWVPDEQKQSLQQPNIEPKQTETVSPRDSNTSPVNDELQRKYRDASFAAALQSKDLGLDPSELSVKDSQSFSNQGQPTQEQQYQDVLNYIRAGRKYAGPYSGGY